MPAGISRDIDIRDLSAASLSTCLWAQPPACPALAAGQVHIWKVHLDGLGIPDEACMVLSTEERQRAERILSTRKRARFKTARAVLRCLLSIYTHQPAESLRFGYKPSGKPFLLDSTQADPVEFNISHSRGLMLAAFSLDSPLGIDLEYKGPIAALDWIVKQYFSANDYRFFQSLPEGRRPGAFLSAWTVKESCGKTEGGGLAGAPEMDCFIPGIQKALSGNGFNVSRHGPYWLARFKPQEGFTAAAAVKSAQESEPFFWEYAQNR